MSLSCLTLFCAFSFHLEETTNPLFWPKRPFMIWALRSHQSCLPPFPSVPAFHSYCLFDFPIFSSFFLPQDLCIGSFFSGWFSPVTPRVLPRIPLKANLLLLSFSLLFSLSFPSHFSPQHFLNHYVNKSSKWPWKDQFQLQNGSSTSAWKTPGKTNLSHQKLQNRY